MMVFSLLFHFITVKCFINGRTLVFEMRTPMSRHDVVSGRISLNKNLLIDFRFPLGPHLQCLGQVFALFPHPSHIKRKKINSFQNLGTREESNRRGHKRFDTKIMAPRFITSRSIEAVHFLGFQCPAFYRQILDYRGRQKQQL